MMQAKNVLQRHGAILWLALALGLLAQWLFVGRRLGISWFIWTTVVLAALAWYGRKAHVRVERRNRWMWPAALFFSFMVFWRANEFLTFLNVMTTFTLLAFIYFFYSSGVVFRLPFSAILTLPLRMAGNSLQHLGPVVGAGVQPVFAGNKRREEFVPVLRGGALALPVVLLFTALLASADLMFNSYLQRMVGLEFEVLAPYIGRGLFVGFVMVIMAGSLGTAVYRGLGADDDDSWIEKIIQDMPRHFSIGSVETATILSLVSALFLFFVGLQFTYLFGGARNISLEGFTYAEYARRGFFELILVASLTLALILVLNWLTRRENKQQMTWFKGLSSLLIVLVLFILAAAFWRMRLYQQAYGYTELRLIVTVFEIWLGLLLIWFLVTVWRRPERFGIGFMAAALGFVLTLNLLNPDAFIVRQNLARYRVMGDLDVFYLTRLSADAVPALLTTHGVVENDERLLRNDYCRGSECEMTMAEILEENLNSRYDMLQEHTTWLLGRAYHHARYEAASALACFVEPETTVVRLGGVRLGCGR
jgi:hypothetical protein